MSSGIPLLCLSLLVSTVAEATALAAQPPDTAVAAFVDSEPIAAGEMRMQMRKLRAEVFDYYSRTYGAKDSPDFGGRRFGATTPATMLRDRALDSCVRIKTQQMIARSEEAIDKIDFISFLHEFQCVNKYRYRKVMEGGIVYGPVTFHIDSYFDYVYSNMITDLRKKMMDRMVFDDASLRLEFPRYRESRSGKPIAREVLFVHGKGANAPAILEPLRVSFQKDTSFDPARTSSTNIACERLKIERMTREVMGKYGRANAGMLLDTARTLKPGMISPVFKCENEEYGFVKCLRICDLSDATFAENRELILDFVKEETFRNIVDERCGNAELRKNQRVLDGLAVW